MQAFAKIIHAKESENHEGKRNDTEDMEIFALQKDRWLGDKSETVNQQRYQGPSLFRIPTPIGTPGTFCPNGTDEDAHAKTNQARKEQNGTDVSQILVCLIVFCNQSHNSIQSHDEENCVWNDGDGDMIP